MRFIVSVIIVSLAFTLILSCSDEKSTSPGSTTGTLKLLLTDAPGYFNEVNITFSEVAVNYQAVAEDDTTDSENEWIVIGNEELTFDLLTLNNGITSLLAEKDFEAGQYNQIRLKIIEAEVVIDTTTYLLDVPSGSKSGLKLTRPFMLEAEGITELIADFDVSRSIHVVGPKQEYKLRPTIRLISNNESGAIAGNVLNYENAPMAYAIAEKDTINSTFINEKTGYFRLSFLPEGDYFVSVTDTLGQVYLNPGVSVTIGNTTLLEGITLE